MVLDNLYDLFVVTLSVDGQLGSSYFRHFPALRETPFGQIGTSYYRESLHLSELETPLIKNVDGTHNSTNSGTLVLNRVVTS